MLPYCEENETGPHVMLEWDQTGDPNANPMAWESDLGNSNMPCSSRLQVTGNHNLGVQLYEYLGSYDCDGRANIITDYNFAIIDTGGTGTPPGTGGGSIGGGIK
jgi:hypothetical protein